MHRLWVSQMPMPLGNTEPRLSNLNTRRPSARKHHQAFPLRCDISLKDLCRTVPQALQAVPWNCRAPLALTFGCAETNKSSSVISSAVSHRCVSAAVRAACAAREVMPICRTTRQRCLMSTTQLRLCHSRHKMDRALQNGCTSACASNNESS